MSLPSFRISLNVQSYRSQLQNNKLRLFKSSLDFYGILTVFGPNWYFIPNGTIEVNENVRKTPGVFWLVYGSDESVANCVDETNSIKALHGD